jgi:hypothetical protein
MSELGSQAVLDRPAPDRSAMGQEETFISRCASCDLSPSRAPLPFYASAVV